MRHVLLLGSPATGTHRVSYATAAAGLVAPASGALGMISGLLRTAVATVDLAAVAMTADEHLSAAANAQKQPAGDPLSLGIAGTWTAPAMGGILPRHACSARCGARRRSGLGGLGRRRACPADLAGYHRAIVRSTGAAMLRSCARRAQLCGYVDNTRALPTYPQAQQATASVYFDCFGVAGFRPCLSQPGKCPRERRCVTMWLRHLCADSDSHSHAMNLPSTPIGLSGIRTASTHVSALCAKARCLRTCMTA